ncbi:hypothetical protein [Stenotrophomonas chelatiphaga]|uniref:hypothetical protein n=1 Tax=Stenotrophomonas chelatiphaga TaxID=517011 RepID=UPI000AED436A|nr:hypothetical protein [Stenotrophomonas chelatiphaga]
MKDKFLPIKILHEQYRDDFLRGELYLNALTYFKKLEGDQLRGDGDEGVVSAHQVNEVSVLYRGSWVPLPVRGPVRTHDERFDNLNILCIYMLSGDPDVEFDRRNEQFGSCAIIIRDLREFLSRVRIAAAKQNWEVFPDPVKYVEEETYEGRMAPFRKFDHFSYQREYRIVFKTEAKGPCKLDIGDIRDITYCITSQEICEIPRVQSIQKEN